ncbi:MAG: hypothetical protein JXQ73_07425 [Phycisphaerae bacterium]|nr:hypothetical protein [Phycisphaerae bacterium]
MRCKNCDYRLWNLTSRQCPECGTPFRPSDYEFIPSSVQFCCPHCKTPYYGTDEKGHLVPPEFDCVGCGRHLHMDDMVLLPTEGIDEEQTKIPDMPWLERAKRGRVRAWFATVKGALFRPGLLMRQTPVASSVGQAWWFAAVTLLVMTLGFVPILTLPFVALMGIGGGPLGVPNVFFAMGVALGVFSLGAGVATLVGIALWGVATHGMLLLTGRTQAGIGRTYHAICYSSGANIVTAVPLLGPYFGWIWWVISAVLSVKEAQQVHGGRAVFAVLSLPVLIAVAVVALYVAAYLPWVMSMASTTTQPAWTITLQTASQRAGALASRIKTYAELHEGRGPSHALDLVVDDGDPNLFLSPDTGTIAESVYVGGIELAKFGDLSRDARADVARKAAETLPKDVVAHRVGDVVFTYHGINFRSMPSLFWVFVISPDPDTHQIEPPTEVCVAIASGICIEFPRSEFAERLAKQNAFRRFQNLPPIPDPNTVTNAKPAVAPPPGGSLP